MPLAMLVEVTATLGRVGTGRHRAEDIASRLQGGVGVLTPCRWARRKAMEGVSLALPCLIPSHV